MRKSHISEDFLDFGRLKVPFKVTFIMKPSLKMFDTSYSLINVSFDWEISRQREISWILDSSSAPKSFRTCKILRSIYFEREICHHRFEYLTLENVYEASKTVFMRKSRSSELKSTI